MKYLSKRQRKRKKKLLRFSHHRSPHQDLQELDIESQPDMDVAELETPPPPAQIGAILSMSGKGHAKQLTPNAGSLLSNDNHRGFDKHYHKSMPSGEAGALVRVESLTGQRNQEGYYHHHEPQPLTLAHFMDMKRFGPPAEVKSKWPIVPKQLAPAAQPLARAKDSPNARSLGLLNQTNFGPLMPLMKGKPEFWQSPLQLNIQQNDEVDANNNQKETNVEENVAAGAHRTPIGYENQRAKSLAAAQTQGNDQEQQQQQQQEDVIMRVLRALDVTDWHNYTDIDPNSNSIVESIKAAFLPPNWKLEEQQLKKDYKGYQPAYIKRGIQHNRNFQSNTSRWRTNNQQHQHHQYPPPVPNSLYAQQLQAWYASQWYLPHGPRWPPFFIPNNHYYHNRNDMENIPFFPVDVTQEHIHAAQLYAIHGERFFEMPMGHRYKPPGPNHMQWQRRQQQQHYQQQQQPPNYRHWRPQYHPPPPVAGAGGPGHSPRAAMEVAAQALVPPPVQQANHNNTFRLNKDNFPPLPAPKNHQKKRSQKD